MFYWAETLLDAGRHKEAVDMFSACAKRPNLSFEKQKLLSIKACAALLLRCLVIFT